MVKHDLQRLAKLLKFAVPYWRAWVGIVVASLLWIPLSLLQPWPMKILVDHILTKNPEPQGVHFLMSHLPWSSIQGRILWVVLFTFAIFLTTSALDVFLNQAWVRVGQRMVYDLSAQLFSSVVRRSLQYHSRAHVGDLLQRVSGDSWCVNSVMDSMIITPVRSLLSIASMLSILFVLNQELTWLSLAIVPLMSLAVFYWGKPIRAAAKQTQEAQGKMQTHVQQVLSGMPVIQAYAQEDREEKRFKQYVTEWVNVQERSTLLTSLNQLGVGIVTTTGTALIIYMGVNQVLIHKMLVGDFLVFLSYLTMMQVRMRALVETYSSIQKTAASAERVFEVLDGPSDIVENPNGMKLKQARGDIQFDHVSFGYGDGLVLRDLHFKISAGEKIAIIGPSGVGKTTLVNMIPRLLDPLKGVVRLDGVDLRDYYLEDLRNQISIVLQEPFLLPLTIEDNIRFSCPTASFADVEKAAMTARAHDFIKKLPAGYQTVLDERGAGLSGGEKQRISVARALLRNSPILILDEPTSALDVETEQLMIEAINTLIRGRTVFLIAHRLSTIRGSDRVIALENGVIKAMGLHEDLIMQSEWYREYTRVKTFRAKQTVP